MVSAQWRMQGGKGAVRQVISKQVNSLYISAAERALKYFKIISATLK